MVPRIKVKVPKHFWNVVGLLLGLTIAFVGAWQLDIVAAGVIAAFYDIVKDWKFWMPAVPPFNWESTYWYYPDAYVRFFILMWVGWTIIFFSGFFWSDEVKESVKKAFKRFSSFFSS